MPGKAQYFTHDATHELDAAIMDGRTLQAGSVAGLRNIKNPIRLARCVMEKSPHVMLVGDGAEAFAKGEDGIAFVPQSYFYTDRAWQALESARERETRRMAVGEQIELGTVGAVALDSHRNLAAGTSTGGMTNKHRGRIGDSPVIGAGTYANNASCAISCTGHGEYFIRFTVAHDVCARVEYLGLSLQAAADVVVRDVLKRAGGEGGVIGIDRHGKVGISSNVTGMGHGYMGPDGEADIRLTGTWGG